MKITESAHLKPGQKQAICRLWNKEYPGKLVYQSFEDFDDYLGRLQHQTHCVLINDDQQIKGWAFAFERELSTWFAVIVDSSIHSKGYGTQLLNRLKENHAMLNGWVIDHDRDIKINGEKYASPMPFYLNHGFKVIEGTRLETEQISAVKIVWEKQ